MFRKQRQTCICLSMPPIMATSLGLHREFETVETGIPVLLISDARVWMGIILSHYPTMATYTIYMQLCIHSPVNLATFFTKLGTNCNRICFTTVSFYEVSRTPYIKS